MQKYINSLNTSAKGFIDAARSVRLSNQVYEDGWDAKKILAHIVFYHEYYSSVVGAIVAGDELPLIAESLNKVNVESAERYSKFSRKELLNRFEKAQINLSRNLMKLKVTAPIPYKKGGRVYEAKDYAEEIARHILKHAKDLRRKKRVKPGQQ